jgi:hypothetical protein
MTMVIVPVPRPRAEVAPETATLLAGAVDG